MWIRIPLNSSDTQVSTYLPTGTFTTYTAVASTIIPTLESCTGANTVDRDSRENIAWIWTALVLAACVALAFVDSAKFKRDSRPEEEFKPM